MKLFIVLLLATAAMAAPRMAYKVAHAERNGEKVHPELSKAMRMMTVPRPGGGGTTGDSQRNTLALNSTFYAIRYLEHMKRVDDEAFDCLSHNNAKDRIDALLTKFNTFAGRSFTIFHNLGYTEEQIYEYMAVNFNPYTTPDVLAVAYGAPNTTTADGTPAYGFTTNQQEYAQYVATISRFFDNGDNAVSYGRSYTCMPNGHISVVEDIISPGPSSSPVGQSFFYEQVYWEVIPPSGPQLGAAYRPLIYTWVQPALFFGMLNLADAYGTSFYGAPYQGMGSSYEGTPLIGGYCQKGTAPICILPPGYSYPYLGQ